MKRFFILASAAIVALASCAKTEVVYKDAPQEISFKALNSVMTKADALGDADYKAINVYAYDSNHSSYFSEGWVAFSFKSVGNPWTAETARYWPVDGGLKFIYYAPTTITATPAYADSKYTLTANLGNTTDFLYGTEVTSGSKSDASVSAVLRHALAKVEVSVKADLAGIKVNSVTLTGAAVSGTLTVNYGAADNSETKNDERLTWTGTTTNTIELLSGNVLSADTPVTNSCYTLPCNPTALVLNYTLPGGSAQQYTHSLSGNTWYDGHEYTYNISIGANEIKFTPSETNWEIVTAEGVVIDPNDTSN